MKIWKTKSGEKITAKEFIKRFKEGINNITPVQKIENETRGAFIMTLGYLVGLISLIVYRKSFIVEWFTYALIIIFFGALWSNTIKWLALRTQSKSFKEMGNKSLDLDKILDSLESEELKEKSQKAKNKELKGGSN